MHIINIELHPLPQTKKKKKKILEFANNIVS